MSEEHRLPFKKKRKLEDPPSEKTYDRMPERVDYIELAKRHPSLQPYLKPTSSGGTTLDYKDGSAVRELNRALLRVYYDLDIRLPENSLCPTVANRLNYLLWIKQNIASEIPSKDLVGLDIGTGASCIYPLLGVRVLSGASFVATDINQESVDVANENVAKNQMIERITVYLNQERKTKLPLDQPEFPLKRFSFSMCNPPFYRSKQEQEELRQRKRGQPSLNTVAKPDELFTEGGEQQFVLEMADESQKLGTRVQWYTTMVGRKGTLAELRARVRKLGAKQVKEGTLLQGVTTRWVLAWSFEDKSCFSVAVSKSSVGEAQKWFEQSMHELDIETGEAEDGYRCAAREITWTRKARRQREKAGASGAPAATGDEQPRSVLVFAASVHDVCTTDAGSAKQEIHMRYLSGEAGPNSLASLYNHLLRQLRQA